MKYSFYNVLSPYQHGFALYNTFTEHVILLNRDVVDRFFGSDGAIARIQTEHPALYDQMVASGFFVDDSLNESRRYTDIAKSTGDAEKRDRFRLIVNPTMDCNLRCWYCYEEKECGSVMNRDVIDRICSLIRKIVISPSIRHFSLSFFGGEPLMKFRSVVLPLIHKATEECEARNVSLSIHFTTNAVLFSPSVVDELLSCGLPLSFQVPFDGGEHFHNKTKSDGRISNAYKKTLDNVKYALSRGCSFVIRCNCTCDNVDSFRTLVDDLTCVSDKSLVIFSVQTVWQESNIEEIRRGENELYEYIFSKGFNHHVSSIPTPKCYADTCDSLVVNYNGDVFKCTANNFSSENREGVLASTGEVCFNSKYNERLRVMYETEVCNQCQLFPICDYCTERKLRIIRKSGHFRECSDVLKEEILSRRLLSVMSYYENH